MLSNIWGALQISIGGIIRYIGNTKDAYTVDAVYRAKLHRGYHPNDGLQAHYDVAPETYKFLILEVLPDKATLKERREVESKYMMLHRDTIANKYRTAERMLQKQKKKEETKLSRRERWLGKNNPNSKIDLRIAQEVLWLKQNSKTIQTQIAEAYDISPSLVSMIGRCRWEGIDPVMPASMAHSGI